MSLVAHQGLARMVRTGMASRLRAVPRALAWARPAPDRLGWPAQSAGSTSGASRAACCWDPAEGAGPVRACLTTRT